MAQRSESRVKYIWTLPSEQAIIKRSLIMARATISFISAIMLTKLVLSNCSDCRGLFHIAHEWHGLSQIFLLRRWFIALSLNLQNKSFPCFNLRFMYLLASIRAYGRHHPRICRRQFTCMLASRQLEILVKTTNFTSKKHTVPNPITSIIHKPSSINHHP